MQALSIMSKVFANGSKVVVSKRNGNTIIQQFLQDGSIYRTKVKNITRTNVGNKKVITKKELFYDGSQEWATGVAQKTTDKVYTADGQLLGARELKVTNADTCNNDLRSIINNMKNYKDVYRTKSFLTPDGNVYKKITIGENGLKEYVTYLPNQYGIGHSVPANDKGIISQQIAGLDFIF